MADGIQRGALVATWTAIRQRQGVIGSGVVGVVAYFASEQFTDSTRTTSFLIGTAIAVGSWAFVTFVWESAVREPRRRLDAAEGKLADTDEVVATVTAARVGSRHELELRQTIDVLKKKVKDGKTCELDSSALGRSFRDHFTDVAGSVDAWDLALPAVDSTEGSFRLELSKRVAAYSGCEPSRATKTADWIGDWVLGSSRNRPPLEFPFEWDRVNDGAGRPTEWSCILVPHGAQRSVMPFAITVEGSESDEHRKTQFENFFAELWTWPELEEVLVRREAVATMRPQLTEALSRLGGRDHYTGQCDRCRPEPPDSSPPA